MKIAVLVCVFIVIISSISMWNLNRPVERRSDEQENVTAVIKVNSRKMAEAGADKISISDVIFDKLPSEVVDIAPLLNSLHITATRSFVSMPAFGANRVGFNISTYSDFRYPIKHLPETSEIRQEWRASARIRVTKYGTPEQIEGFQAWSWIHALYRMTPRGFVYRETDLDLDDDRAQRAEEEHDERLLVGIPRENQSLDAERGELLLDSVSPLNVGDPLWKLARMELLGILKNDPPKAYVYNPPEFPQISSYLTARKINDFEIKALENLKRGSENVTAWDSHEKRIYFLGAIRATDSCLECHRDKARGDLLGAFSYWIEKADL